MRLGTFNILHGRSWDDGVVDLDRFAGAVRGLDCDVLALQEVDRAQVRSGGGDLAAVAARAMGAVEHRFTAAVHGTPGFDWVPATGDEPAGSPAYGVALLSRYPVRSWHVVRLPALRGYVPMFVPGRRRPLLVRDEPRVAVAALVESPLGPMTVVSTHLTFVPGWNARQLRRLVRELAGCRRPLILMGDLNTGPGGARRASGMQVLAKGATFPVGRPQRQLDHILADGLQTPAEPRSQTVRTAVSDHRALLVDLEA